MLDSVDLKVRLSKATELVDRHLQVPVDLLLVNVITQLSLSSAYFYGVILMLHLTVHTCSGEDYTKS